MADLFFVGVVLALFALSGGLVWVLEQLLRRS